MLEYSFKLERNPDPNAPLGQEYKAVSLQHPDVETSYGRMPMIATDLSLVIREYFMELMDEGKSIPMSYSTDEFDEMTIYMPSGTSWRIMLWNLMVSRGITFEDLAKLRSIQGNALRDGRTVLEQVKDTFNLNEGSKYRELLPYAQALGVKLTVGLVDDKTNEIVKF